MQREFELIGLLYEIKSLLIRISGQLDTVNDTLNGMMNEQIENSNTIVAELSRIAEATGAVSDEFERVMKKEV